MKSIGNKNYVFLSGVAFVLFVLIFSPNFSQANIGVGVGVGEIKVQEKLHAGTIYQLPVVPVLNTGDETSDYAMSVEYNGAQNEIHPTQEWFTFSPATFNLEPGKVQTVNVSLNVPIKATPGDYFAYIEAHPVRKTQLGGTTLNVAAAVKLYFTITPSNIFQGIYYRTISFINNNAPWTYVIIVVVFVALLLIIFRKYFSFNIGISRKQ